MKGLIHKYRSQKDHESNLGVFSMIFEQNHVFWLIYTRKKFKSLKKANWSLVVLFQKARNIKNTLPVHFSILDFPR